MRLAWLRPLLLLVALGVVSPRTARADAAATLDDGASRGVLVPTSVTALRVERESISYAVSRDLTVAAVTALHRLENTSGIAESLDLAYVSVHGDGAEPAVAIEVDGGPAHARRLGAGELLTAKLGAWLAEHEQVAKELRAPGGCTDPDKLRALVVAAGGRCADACTHLVAWQEHLARPARDEVPAERDDRAVEAAREAIPEIVTDFVDRWSTSDSRTRLSFLLFHLDVAPHQRRVVAIHDEQRGALDRVSSVNPTFGFAHLLAPAKRWQGFGALDLTVRVPPRARFASPLPFRREGDTYRAELAGPPSEDARFEVSSLDGLLFGMSRANGYWAVVIGAVAVVTAAMGAAAGRLWPASSGLRRFMPLLSAGPLAAVLSFSILVLLLAFFPPYALGSGTGAILRAALVVALAVPAGAAVSVATRRPTAS